MQTIRISNQVVQLEERQQYLSLLRSSLLTLPFILLELIPLNAAGLLPTEL